MLVLAEVVAVPRLILEVDGDVAGASDGVGDARDIIDPIGVGADGVGLDAGVGQDGAGGAAPGKDEDASQRRAKRGSSRFIGGSV
jgi:hypothetical protein